ncbi:MAG: homocysteine S-methyltransferase family protein [Eubacteriales bacterium]|jgi:5-methyltetrahydrofolate--homocysteine methyltransferase|nr:homocysteine S-methyltransferase family protein [Eubacteriales bacterium]
MIDFSKVLYFDGAMGTMLQKKGVLGAGDLPEDLNLSNPDVIYDIHKAYIGAGCDIIKTNTFGLSRLKFPKEGKVEEIAKAAVGIARRAAGDKMVAIDIGPTGKLLAPYGDLKFEEAVSIFGEVISFGEKYGADLVLIETMNDTYELKAAILAAKEYSSLPVFATVTFDEAGRLMSGADVACAAALMESLGVCAMGINCGLGPKQIKELFTTMREYSQIPVILNPNAGLPKVIDGETVFDVSPEEFARDMHGLIEMGANVVGGCCGTTPEHIRAMIEMSKGMTPLPIGKKEHTVVSSYGKAVFIGEKPVIIGERINPTGKKLLKQALRTGDMDYLVQEALKQVEAGAHILDVNVGLPEINEEETMEKAVSVLQEITSLPLQIDSSSPKVLERALRIYNGKALVNSVNGKKESMEAVFPLVKKYGGVVVALTLDEDGIPNTAQGRLKIARKIVETAKTYGIDKKDIIVDPLTMAISSDESQGKVTLEALELIKNTLGVKTVLGVSNISFGLPKREIITGTFFAMALQKGLDAAIINPCSRTMMDAWYSFCALVNLDQNCREYVKRYADASDESAPDSVLTLKDIIIKGLKEKAAGKTKELLSSMSPMDIINEQLVPALDVVGEGFEKGTVFLPQLLLSADTAKAAFDAIRDFIESSGIQVQKKEKIIIATVKGDIHDIGKNIVKVMLENYGYDVIDLGKDVDIDRVVNAALEGDVSLVGLSALMTTTVASMGETIKALKLKKPGCKVMVGGAVLTKEYAKMIDADYYAKDAMAAVAIAQKHFGR